MNSVSFLKICINTNKKYRAKAVKNNMRTPKMLKRHSTAEKTEMCRAETSFWEVCERPAVSLRQRKRMRTSMKGKLFVTYEVFYSGEHQLPRAETGSLMIQTVIRCKNLQQQHLRCNHTLCNCSQKDDFSSKTAKTVWTITNCCTFRLTLYLLARNFRKH